MNFENIFKALLTGLVLLCLSVPVIAMLKFEATQWQVFSETWLFLIYAIVLFIVGSATVKTIWEDR